MRSAAFMFLFLWMITSVAGRSTLGAAIAPCAVVTQ
jgi:hypothetical protein